MTDASHLITAPCSEAKEPESKPPPATEDVTVLFDFYLEQAQGLVEQQRWDEAINSYQQALKYQLIRQQQDSSKQDSSEQDSSEQVQPIQHPKQDCTHLALGALLMQQGRVDEAIDCYEQAIALELCCDGTYPLLGLALEEKRRIPGAIACYRRALRLNSTQPAWVHQKLADALCWQATQNYKQAAIGYVRTLSLCDRLDKFYLLRKTLDNLYASLSEYTERSLHDLWRTIEKTDSKAYLLAQRLTTLGFLNKEQPAVNPTSYYFVNERLKVVYCSIPKNACTLFKTMLIDHSDSQDELAAHEHDVHKLLNHTASRSSAQKLLHCINSDEYFKFVILRDPFSRIVSGYLDKIAKHRVSPEAFAQDVIFAVQAELKLKKDTRASITFSQFVDYLVRTPDAELNDHWRPQHNFVAAVSFDFVGQFESIEGVVLSLEKKLDIHIRKKVSNHITRYQKFEQEREYHNMYPRELRALGGMPSAENLLTKELIWKIQLRYKKDIELYNRQFKAVAKAG